MVARGMSKISFSFKGAILVAGGGVTGMMGNEFRRELSGHFDKRGERGLLGLLMVGLFMGSLGLRGLIEAGRMRSAKFLKPFRKSSLVGVFTYNFDLADLKLRWELAEDSGCKLIGGGRCFFDFFTQDFDGSGDPAVDGSTASSLGPVAPEEVVWEFWLELWLVLAESDADSTELKEFVAELFLLPSGVEDVELRALRLEVLLVHCGILTVWDG